MQEYNLIVVFDERADKMLMCKRKKDPYKGLLNFVGGKIEAGETGLDAAYRELEEETAIARDAISSSARGIFLNTISLIIHHFYELFNQKSTRRNSFPTCR